MKPTQAMQPLKQNPIGKSELLKGAIALGCLLGTTACQSVPKTATPETLTEQNKPGIVLVQANHNVEFSYPEPVFDEGLAAPISRDVRKKFAQGVFSNETEATAYLIKQLVSQPVKYMRPGKRQQDEAEVPTTGTGFIVTSDGTVATAAHVVSNEGAEIKKAMAGTALKKITLGQCKELVQELNQNEKVREATNAKELMDLCVDGFSEYYAKYLEINKVETQTTIVMQSPQPGQNSSPQVIPSEIKKVGTQIPESDVALLKISSDNNNFPTVGLGEDKSVAAGQRVFSLSYPGAINDSDNKNLPEPTLTTGAVSARQSGLIQTEAAVSPGSSGGPLFNEKGEVTGVASFIKVNQAGAAVGGANFFVPVGVLKQFLQEGNVTPKASTVSQSYARAIDLFENKRYKKALEQFKQIRDINPNFPYIQQKISQTMAELPNEPFSMPRWAYIVGGMVLLCGVGSYGAKRYLMGKTVDPTTASPMTALRHRLQQLTTPPVAAGDVSDRANPK
ncbi:MAG: trypsin-like peptidase domain-containing protein [Leptolyngbyaceae cyanobacterium]